MKWLRLSLVLLLFLAACRAADPAVSVRLNSGLISGEAKLAAQTGAPGTYTFGFDRRLEPKEDVRIYARLLAYLNRATGYRFALSVTPREGSLVDAIGAGTVDFAAVGTLTYLQAHERFGATMLVRGINAEGENVYRAAIVTRVDSSIASIADLAGRSMAFGARTSTQGYLIPRLMLEQAGIELSGLKDYEFTGSHAEAANAVISGRAEAGGMQDTLAAALASRGLLRVVAWSAPYPSSGILAAAHVPPEVAEAVQTALLGFDPTGADSAELYRWDRTEMPNGFSVTDDADYAELRPWAEKYGLLEP